MVICTASKIMNQILNSLSLLSHYQEKDATCENQVDTCVVLFLVSFVFRFLCCYPDRWDVIKYQSLTNINIIKDI